MPFHFKKAEPPARAVRRLCRERIGAARNWLRQERRPKAVHGLRKEIKKCRAALRLVRSGVGRKDYRKAMKGLRASADRLAASRDARVMLRAFEELTEHSGRRFAKIGKKLRRHGRREIRRIRKAGADALAERWLRKTRRRVAGLEIRAGGWRAIEPGLRQSYRRGRDAWQSVCQAPSPEAFHEWRKHVKNLGYHLQMICPAWPVATRATMAGLEQLGDSLGNDHDLALLQQFVGEHADIAPSEAAALGGLIAAREKKLQAGALKLGRRLYTATPKVFCRRLREEWQAWRGLGGRK